MSITRQIRLLLSLMLLLWLISTGLVGEHVYRGISSRKWVHTECQVISSGPTGFKYQYQTPDGIYQGTRRAFKLSSRKSLSSYPVGSKASIYVHPEKYQLSVLETGTDGISMLGLFISSIASILSALALRKTFNEAPKAV
jgi:hypothetical protein